MGRLRLYTGIACIMVNLGCAGTGKWWEKDPELEGFRQAAEELAKELNRNTHTPQAFCLGRIEGCGIGLEKKETLKLLLFDTLSEFTDFEVYIDKPRDGKNLGRLDAFFAEEGFLGEYRKVVRFYLKGKETLISKTYQVGKKAEKCAFG